MDRGEEVKRLEDEVQKLRNQGRHTFDTVYRLSLCLHRRDNDSATIVVLSPLDDPVVAKTSKPAPTKAKASKKVKVAVS